MMTRRTALATIAAGAAAAASPAPAPRTKMGICTTCYLTAWKPKDLAEFLEHGIEMGAGGIQSPVNSHDPAYLAKVRKRAEQAGMFLETMGPLPSPQDPDAFPRLLQSSKALGAVGLRSACLSGRRYETFGDLETWKKFVAASEKAVAEASRQAERAKYPVSIENHKDWTADEMVALMKRYGHEWFGVCLDTGNNFSLLDDPYEPVEKLAPYALTTHIKDMGLAEYKEGFLLSEVIFGRGVLDLPRILKTIRTARPKTNLVLEMITRNPLKVPVLTEKYWLTLDDARHPHRLASALKAIRTAPSSSPLPGIDGLSHEEVRRLEVENVRACLAYAREHLERS